MTEVVINTIIGQPDGLSQYDVIQELVKLNDSSITGIEYRLELFNPDKMLEEIDEYLEIQEKTGWKHYLSVPEDFIIEDGINPAFESFVKLTKKLNCDNVKLTIGNHEVIADLNFESVKSLLDEANITLTLENDQSETTGFAGTVKNVLNTLHNKGLAVGHTFDIGNWYISGESIDKAYDLLKNEISFLHIKNIHEDHTTSLFTDGVADAPKYFGGYPAVIEYAMPKEVWADEISQVVAAFK
ncbi:TIM barrel protein [Aerococcaceae bacterium DSM 111022]|nr:TIM barrel protein [Aerococcaceae bacterium DSM 111022]